MRPARESDIPVRVKNSYNPRAPGTLITKERDMTEVCGYFVNNSMLFTNFFPEGNLSTGNMMLLRCP